MFHSEAMVDVVVDLMRVMLPSNQDFVMRNMKLLAHPHKGTQVFSVVMLLVTSTGVFLPLEVALNQVWGVKKDRNYLHNQAVSLGLAAGVGALVLASCALTAGQRSADERGSSSGTRIILCSTSLRAACCGGLRRSRVC